MSLEILQSMHMKMDDVMKELWECGKTCLELHIADDDEREKIEHIMGMFKSMAKNMNGAQRELLAFLEMLVTDFDKFETEVNKGAKQ